MHRRIAILVVLCGFVVFAQKPGWLPPAGHPTMPLWANGAPDNPPSAGPEADVTTAKDNLIAGKPLIRLGNVSNPTLTLYTPRNNSGAAVVVFPGGGYRILAIDLEGTEVCEWLNSAGVTCALVKYRVPNSGPYPKSAAALQDAQRAVSIVRSHAKGMACGSEKNRSAGLFRGSASGCRAEYALRPASLPDD